MTHFHCKLSSYLSPDICSRLCHSLRQHPGQAAGQAHGMSAAPPGRAGSSGVAESSVYTLPGCQRVTAFGARFRELMGGGSGGRVPDGASPGTGDVTFRHRGRLSAETPAASHLPRAGLWAPGPAQNQELRPRSAKHSVPSREPSRPGPAPPRQRLTAKFLRPAQRELGTARDPRPHVRPGPEPPSG